MWTIKKRSKLFCGFLEIIQADIIGVTKSRIWYCSWVCFCCAGEKRGMSDVKSSGGKRRWKRGWIRDAHVGFLFWQRERRIGLGLLFYYILITLMNSWCLCPGISLLFHTSTLDIFLMWSLYSFFISSLYYKLFLNITLPIRFCPNFQWQVY